MYIHNSLHNKIQFPPTVLTNKLAILLPSCVCVCLFATKGKTTNIDGSNELLADFKLYKEQKQQQAFAKTF